MFYPEFDTNLHYDQLNPSKNFPYKNGVAI